MSAPLRVAAVVGTTRSVSKTKALTQLIIGRLAAHAEISAEVIEIHALNPGLGTAVERPRWPSATSSWWRRLLATEQAEQAEQAVPVN